MSRVRAVAPFVLLSVLWGFSFPAIEIGLDHLDPVLFAAFRYDLAGVLLVSYVGVTRGTDALPRTRRDLAAVLAGGLFMISPNALLFVGQGSVASSVSALLQSFVPVATALFAFVLLPEERLSTAGAVGVLLGFVGVSLIAQPDPSNLRGGDTLGRLLILCQVVLIALGGVLVRYLDTDLSGATLAGWSMTVGAPVLHLASLRLGEPFAFPTVPTAIGSIVYLGVFSTAVAFVIYFTLLSRHGATQASLVSYLVPVVATVAGVVAFGESFGAPTAVGFLVVFAGFVLLERRSIRALVVDRRMTEA